MMGKHCCLPSLHNCQKCPTIIMQRELTCHKEIKPVSDITLVAGEVNTTALGGLFRLVGSKLRSKRNATAQNNAGVFPLRWLVGFFITINILNRDSAGIVNQRIGELSLHKIVIIAQVGLVVSSRAHFTDVRGEWTTQNALLGPEIEVVSVCKTRVVLVGG